jgi:hypothetical protein
MRNPSLTSPLAAVRSQCICQSGSHPYLPPPPSSVRLPCGLYGGTKPMCTDHRSPFTGGRAELARDRAERSQSIRRTRLPHVRRTEPTQSLLQMPLAHAWGGTNPMRCSRERSQLALLVGANPIGAVPPAINAFLSNGTNPIHVLAAHWSDPSALLAGIQPTGREQSQLDPCPRRSMRPNRMERSHSALHLSLARTAAGANPICSLAARGNEPNWRCTVRDQCLTIV